MALMRVDCCVCHKVVKPPRKVHINNTKENELVISHTYCKECEKIAMAEIEGWVNSEAPTSPRLF